MGIKKPVPREGRVVFAQVVKLVNTGDCHSPGLCSDNLHALRVRSPSWAAKGDVIVIYGLGFVNEFRTRQLTSMDRISGSVHCAT